MPTLPRGLHFVGAALFWMTAMAHAVPIPVTNPSFESPVTPPNSFITNAPPPGWAAYGDSLDFGSRTIGVLNPNTTALYLDPVPDGSNVGVTFLDPAMNDEAGLQQTLGATLQTLTEYTLTVEVGNLANDMTPFDFDGFPGYRIDLMAGTAVLASDDDTLLPGEGRFLTSTVQVSIGASHPNAGQALGIRLVNLDAAPGIEVNFDDVRLDAVPLGTCPAVPPVGCKTATSGKGSLALGRKIGTDSKNSLAWTWKGQETMLAELGDPAGMDDYRFCLYDGGTNVVLDLPATAGGTCGTKPCWKASSKGFTYKNKLGTTAGLVAVALKSGGAGKAALSVKAKGASLSLPSLPLLQTPNPVRVVLANEATGLCWTALYSTPPKDPSSTVKWKVKND
jgi:hapalindole H/12-epi-hapalindole U/12-epi-fischerindole U synthase